MFLRCNFMKDANEHNKLAGIGIAIVAVVAVVWGVNALKQRTLVSTAQASPPAVRIQAGSNVNEYWPISGLDKSLLAFTLINDGPENILVTGLTAYVTSSPPNANTTSTPALMYYKLRNASSSVQYGTTVWRASLGPTPQYAQVSWRNISITVPSRGRVPLVIKNDVANVGSGQARYIVGTSHQALLVSSDAILPVSIVARGAVGGVGATISGSVTGGTKTVSAGVLHAGVNPTSPSGLVILGNEQIIAKYSLWHEDRGLRLPSIGGWTMFSFAGNITIRAPRVLRVYRDSVTPANLLGSVTLTNGLLQSQQPGLNLAAWTINGVQATPSVLIITMDTRDAVSGNWLSLRLVSLRWTDGFIQMLRPTELPLTANQLRY